MGLILLLAVGGLLGWLCAIVASVQKGRAKLLYIAAGVIGAVGAGLIAASGTPLDEISAHTMMFAIVGAVSLMLFAHLVRSSLQTQD